MSSPTDTSPRLLLEDYSPDGGLVALVQADDRVVYLHLVGHNHADAGTLSCWVRNLQPAPMTLDEQPRDKPPLMPFDACAHPVGLPAPDPDRLRTVWFPGGDGVALFDHNELLAVIPPWAGVDECTGYARDCTGQTPIAWFLGAPVNNPVRDRVREAAAFWESWGDASPWRPFQEGILGAWAEHFGPHTHYYSVDGGSWPPRFVARAGTDGHVFFTGGMSIRPQPKIEAHCGEPERLRRVELALALDPELARTLDDSEAVGLARVLSRLAAFPWMHYGWLGPGHTVPTTGIPLGASLRRFDALLVHADPPDAPAISLPGYRNDSVNLLWLIPITSHERQLAIVASESDAQDAESQDASRPATTPRAAQVLESLWRSGASWIHTDREVLA